MMNDDDNKKDDSEETMDAMMAVMRMRRCVCFVSEEGKRGGREIWR